MKNLKNALLALSILAMAFSACKKDDKTVTELLLNGSWKVTAMTSDPAIDWNGNGTLVTNVYAQLDACTKDDLTIFKAGNIASFDEGATKCDPSDPQTIPGVWILSADEKSITLDGDSWTILSLDESTLKIQFTIADSGVNYVISATLSH